MNIEKMKIRRKSLENISVAVWYKKIYDTDPLGSQINKSISFADVLYAIVFGEDIYDCLGVSDSLIRERVFCGLAGFLVTTYERIYNIWVKKPLSEFFTD